MHPPSQTPRRVGLFVLLLGACGEPVYFPEPLPLQDSGGADGADGGGSDGTDGTDGTDSGTNELPCSSQDSVVSHNLQVENQRSTAVSLLWVDYFCEEIDYGTIVAGGTVVQPTYVGHIWAFRDSTSRELISWLRIEDVEPNTMVLP